MPVVGPLGKEFPSKDSFFASSDGAGLDNTSSLQPHQVQSRRTVKSTRTPQPEQNQPVRDATSKSKLPGPFTSIQSLVEKGLQIVSKSSPQEEIEVYTADNEIADSLILEASMLTPQQQRLYTTIGKNITQTFIMKYRQYIPPHTLQESDGTENRIVVMDNNTFNTFYREWDTSPKGIGIKPDKDIAATYFPQGKIIAIDYPSDIFELYSPESRAYLIKLYGNEEEAIKASRSFTLIDRINHEVVHTCEDETLSEPFSECATRYYQRENARNLHLIQNTNEKEEERITFYQNLIDEFGEDANGDSYVHKVFFGAEIDSGIKQEILSRFTPQVLERLFPDGHGLV